MAVKVEGIRELTAAFAKADRTLRNDMRDALEEAAQPVRRDAQALAANGVARGAGDPWSRMRVGSYRNIAYVAPVERGGLGKRRPAFADRLLGRAMIPALDRNITEVARRVDRLIEEVVRVWGGRGF